MKGKIKQWKDDRGFGFIQPDDGTKEIFFHISSVKTNERRPKVGDTVFFDSIRDSQEKTKAKSVIIEGVKKINKSSTRVNPTRIEPPQKNLLDYILIFICVSFLAISIFIFYQSENLGNSLIFCIPTIISFLLLNRQKEPKEKSFYCSKCRVITKHNQRTIRAWNRGFTKLYCETCHLEWLKNNPCQKDNFFQSRGSGCFGSIFFIIIVPAMGYFLIHNYLI